MGWMAVFVIEIMDSWCYIAPLCPLFMPNQPNAIRMVPEHRVFVDFENVQAVDLSLLGTAGVAFTFFLGVRQTKMEVELVEKLIAHAPTIQMIRLAHEGKNALDFMLVHYLGRASVAEPACAFHIISKDKGYDSLVEHLQGGGFKVSRHPDFTSLPFAARQKTCSSQGGKTSSMFDRVREHLAKNKRNRPKRRQSLVSCLASLGGKEVKPNQIEAWIQKLISAGCLSVDDQGRVTYRD